MTSRAGVSVLIAAHNAAGTLTETIHSVLAQTVRANEIIIVDDGSVDDTHKIASEFSARETTVTAIQQKNAGVAKTRNYLIRNANSEFCAFIDSDDIWRRDHLALHLQRLSSDLRLGVSFSRARFIDRFGQPTGQVARPKLHALALEDWLAGNPTTTCSTVVFRKGAVAETKFRSELTRAEDQAWLFDLARQGTWIEGVDELSVDYRVSEEGLSADLDKMAAAWDHWISGLRSDAPHLLMAHEQNARARMHRYLARRALRLKKQPAVARAHLAKALISSPQLLLKEPRATTLTVAAIIADHLTYSCRKINMERKNYA